MKAKQTARAGVASPEPAPEPTPNTIADLFAGTESLGRGSQEAVAVLETLIRHHPCANRVLGTLERLADDAGLPTTGTGWASSATITHAEYDQLLLLGEASSWADPGFLLDPEGTRGAELAIYVRIARARLDRGDPGASAAHLAWLEAAATREDTVEGFTARRASALAAWPFNADGDMDGPGGDPYRMIIGALTPVEIRIRGLMAAAWERLETAPDDLRPARTAVLRLLETVHSSSLRMSGLAQAALARVYLTQARVAGKALPTIEGWPPLDSAARFADHAQRLILRSRKATPQDHRGLAALDAAIVAQQAMAGGQRDVSVVVPASVQQARPSPIVGPFAQETRVG